MNGRIVLGVLLVLVLVAGAVALVNNAYQAGVAQGLAESGKLPSPGTGGVPYPYYGAPYFYHWPFGFGFFGFLFPLFFFLVLFTLVRGFFWRGRWGGPHGSWKAGVPPMFEEWHRRAHESQERGTKA